MRRIARRYGLDAGSFSLLPEVGIFNRIYALGEDFILRVPRDRLISAADASKEAIAVPVAREAGVRAPRIVAFEVASFYGDENVEARLLWRHLQLSLYLLRREPQPGRSWAERPLGMLLDVIRFSLDPPGEMVRMDAVESSA